MKINSLRESFKTLKLFQIFFSQSMTNYFWLIYKQISFYSFLPKKLLALFPCLPVVVGLQSLDENAIGVIVSWVSLLSVTVVSKEISLSASQHNYLTASPAPDLVFILSLLWSQPCGLYTSVCGPLDKQLKGLDSNSVFDAIIENEALVSDSWRVDGRFNPVLK